MRSFIVLSLLAMISMGTFAATKESGSTTLKNFEPAGTTDKNHKKQQFDLSFASTTGKDYTCRTSEKTKIKATDFVVGTNVTYEIKGNKGKVKTSAGKQVDCTIVRVADATPETK